MNDDEIQTAWGVGIDSLLLEIILWFSASRKICHIQEVKVFFDMVTDVLDSKIRHNAVFKIFTYEGLFLTLLHTGFGNFEKRFLEVLSPSLVAFESEIFIQKTQPTRML